MHIIMYFVFCIYNLFSNIYIYIYIYTYIYIPGASKTQISRLVLTCGCFQGNIFEILFKLNMTSNMIVQNGGFSAG